jgi:hypothetical protein
MIETHFQASQHSTNISISKTLDANFSKQTNSTVIRRQSDDFSWRVHRKILLCHCKRRENTEENIFFFVIFIFRKIYVLMLVILSIFFRENKSIINCIKMNANCEGEKCCGSEVGWLGDFSSASIGSTAPLEHLAQSCKLLSSNISAVKVPRMIQCCLLSSRVTWHASVAGNLAACESPFADERIILTKWLKFL